MNKDNIAEDSKYIVNNLKVKKNEVKLQEIKIFLKKNFDVIASGNEICVYGKYSYEDIEKMEAAFGKYFNISSFSGKKDILIKFSIKNFNKEIHFKIFNEKRETFDQIKEILKIMKENISIINRGHSLCIHYNKIKPMLSFKLAKILGNKFDIYSIEGVLKLDYIQ